MLNTDGHKLAVIGDRLATDMVLGHLAGGLSVLVLPWNTMNEQLGIMAARSVENFAWKNLLKCGLQPHKNEVIKKLQFPY